MWLDELKKKQDPTIHCLQNPHLSSEDTQAQSKKYGKDIPCKQKPKDIRASYTYIKQNQLKAKNDNKRQRRSLYNDVGGQFNKKISRWENICTQH